MTDPWDRQEGEGPVPFSLFREYLMRGVPRPSLVTFAMQKKKSVSVMRHYSSRFKWAERLLAWDERVVKLEQDVVLTEAQKMAKDQLSALRMARHLGTLTLKEFLLQAKNTGSAGIDARTAMTLVKHATELERLIVGEATERIETSETELDLSRLSGEEAEHLLVLLAKLERV
jgi:hypothetical protein